jgi:hypothetical protein
VSFRDWWHAVTCDDKDLALLDVALALAIVFTPALRRQEWLRDVAWALCMSALVICLNSIRKHQKALAECRRRLKDLEDGR